MDEAMRNEPYVPPSLPTSLRVVDEAIGSRNAGTELGATGLEALDEAEVRSLCSKHGLSFGEIALVTSDWGKMDCPPVHGRRGLSNRILLTIFWPHLDRGVAD